MRINPSVIQQYLSCDILILNNGLNDGESKIRSKGPVFKELTVQQKGRHVGHKGNMDRIALADCRRNIREEYLYLPRRAHIFTEELEKGKEEFVS